MSRWLAKCRVPYELARPGQGKPSVNATHLTGKHEPANTYKGLIGECFCIVVPFKEKQPF